MYPMDFKGVPYEGTASAERPGAVPLGKWLRLVQRWASLLDGLDTVLKIGHDNRGNADVLFNWATVTTDARRAYQDN